MPCANNTAAAASESEISHVPRLDVGTLRAQMASARSWLTDWSHGFPNPRQLCSNWNSMEWLEKKVVIIKRVQWAVPHAVSLPQILTFTCRMKHHETASSLGICYCYCFWSNEFALEPSRSVAAWGLRDHQRLALSSSPTEAPAVFVFGYPSPGADICSTHGPKPIESPGRIRLLPAHPT